MIGLGTALGLVVAGAVLLVTAMRPRRYTAVPDELALAILEQRYAVGEIDRAELAVRRAVLHS